MNQSSPQDKVVAGEAPADRVGKTKTIYDAGFGEIFWKNFVAGMSRAFGALFLYMVMTFLVGVVLFQYVWPRVAPLLDSLLQMTDSIRSAAGIALPGLPVLPGNFSSP